MWVPTLLLPPERIRIFGPKTTKFGPKLAFLVILGQALPAHFCPVVGLVGGCGARAISRKTPIFFINIAGHEIGNIESHKCSVCVHFCSKG